MLSFKIRISSVQPAGSGFPIPKLESKSGAVFFSFSLFYLCLTIDLLSSPRSLYFPLDIGWNIKLNWETDRKMRRKLLPLVWSGRIQKGKHLEILPAIFATSNEGKTGGERGEIPPSQLGSKGKISSPHACWRRISGRLNQLIRPSCINVLCVWRRQYVRYTGETRTRALGLCCVCCKGWTPTEAKNFSKNERLVHSSIFKKGKRRKRALWTTYILRAPAGSTCDSNWLRPLLLFFLSFLFLPLDLPASKLCHLAYTKPHKRTRLTD